MASLILMNGAPGSGKSTLARLLADERPLALMLDIDTLRGQLGRWSDDPGSAGMAARRLALAMLRTHLGAGHDVVVPQFLFRLPFILELERVAGECDAVFVEIALISTPEEASARFAARADSRDANHQDAVRLQQAPGAQPIEELYVTMIEMLRERPSTVFVEAMSGDIVGTLAAVREAVERRELPRPKSWTDTP